MEFKLDNVGTWSPHRSPEPTRLCARISDRFAVPEQGKSKMKIRARLVLAVSLGGCMFAGKPGGGSTADYLEVHGPNLGWGGISLYETRQVVEKNLGKPLSVDPQASPTCGQFASKLSLHDRQLVLQWSSSAPDATLDSLRISLPASEVQATLASLVDQFQAHIPDLVVLSSDRDSAILRYADNQRLVLNLRTASSLWLTYQACVD